MSERARYTADERAARAMSSGENRSGNKTWLMIFAIVCAIVGSMMVYGVFFTDNNDGELPLGLDAIKITRTCDFVTLEGTTYEVCHDGTMGIFERLEQNQSTPLTESQQSNQ